METKKNKVLLIIGIVIVVLIIALLILLLFKNEKSVSADGVVGAKLKIKAKNDLYDMSIKVNDVQKSVKYVGGDTLDAVFDLDGIYTNVKVTIGNNSKTDISINDWIIQMYLTDASKEVIADCYHGVAIQDDKLINEKLGDTVKSNSQESGYVYCMTEAVDSKYLLVKIPTKTKAKDGSTIFNDYYFTLE